LTFFDIRFIGPRVEACSISINKFLTKSYSNSLGINVLDYKIYNKSKSDEINIKNYPVIIKPLKLGSSIGVSIVNKKDDLQYALDSAFEFDNDILIEPFINNIKEYNLAGCKIDNDIFKQLDKELRFLSNKNIIYGCNVDENSLQSNTNEYVKIVQKHAASIHADVIVLCAKIEEDLIGLDEDETVEFLSDLGIEVSGLDQIIRKSFDKLDLQSYFTAGKMEVRAWTIKKNTKAPKAAAVIHNDFEKGFIKAQVISYDDFIACNGEIKAKEMGKLRLEGKEYIVQDGDVMHFRFNV